MLSIAGPGRYFQNVEENLFGTSSGAAIRLSIFSSPTIVAFMAAFFLNNTVSGTCKKCGLRVWDAIKPANINNNPEYVEVYSLPIGLAKMFRNCGYLEYLGLGRLLNPPAMDISRVVETSETCAALAGLVLNNPERTMMTSSITRTHTHNSQNPPTSTYHHQSCPLNSSSRTKPSA